MRQYISQPKCQLTRVIIIYSIENIYNDKMRWMLNTKMYIRRLTGQTRQYTCQANFITLRTVVHQLVGGGFAREIHIHKVLIWYLTRQMHQYICRNISAFLYRH